MGATEFKTIINNLSRLTLPIALNFIEVTMYIRLSTMLSCVLSYNAIASTTVTDPNDIEIIEVVNSRHIISPNYQVIHREDFLKTSQTLSDLLQNINGIQIRQISGLGNPTSISIRGSSSKQVQLYIDGQLVNDSQFGGFDLNQIPIEQIESVEVSKNQAIGTGATPIGGVIRINTYNPDKSATKVSIAAGDFNYKEINFLKNIALNTHSFSFGGNYVTSDNNYSYLVPQSFNNSSESITEKLRNNEFTKKTLFINEAIQYKAHNIRFNVKYLTQEKAIPNYQNNSPENRDTLTSDTIRYSYQHQWTSQSQWLDSIEFEAYQEDKDEYFLRSPDGIIKDTNNYDTTKQHVGFKSFLTWRTLTFTPYVDFTQQKFISHSELNGKASECNGISTCDISAKQQQINVGTRIEWASENHPLSTYFLTNHLEEKNDNIALNQVDAERLTVNNDFDTYELGIKFQYKGIDILSNANIGKRTPTLFELFGDRGSFKGNDNLLPEQAKTISLGVKYNHNNFSISSSVYQQQLENSIVAIFNSSGIGTYDNVGSANLYGLELEGQYQVFDTLSISAQGHILDTETESSFVAFNNKKLPGTYHQQYSIALKYQPTPHWYIHLKTTQDKELFFNLANKVENTQATIGNGNPADRTLSNLTFGWNNKKHSVILSLQNIFNQKYQDLANRPSQGRNIQLKYSLKRF